MGWAVFIEICENFSFEIEFFRSSLNDKINVLARVFQVVCEGNVGSRCSGLFLCQFPFFDAPRQVAIHEGICFLQHCRDDISAFRLIPIQGTKKRDLVTHIAGANHTNVFYVFDFHLSILSMIFMFIC